jgi:hypothetical protein
MSVAESTGVQSADPDVLEALTTCDMIEATPDGVGRGEAASDRQISSRSTTGLVCSCQWSAGTAAGHYSGRATRACAGPPVAGLAILVPS